jgi:signal transduction histidine kinase
MKAKPAPAAPLGKLLLVSADLRRSSLARRAFQRVGFQVRGCRPQTLARELGERTPAPAAPGQPEHALALRELPFAAPGFPLPTAQQLEGSLRAQRRSVAATLRSCLRLCPEVRLAGLFLFDASRQACLRFESLGPAREVLPQSLPFSEYPLLAWAYRSGEALYLTEACSLPSSLLPGGLPLPVWVLIPLGSPACALLLLASSEPASFTTAEAQLLSSSASALETTLANAYLRLNLQASEVRYRSILDTVPFLIALLREDGTVVEINPRLSSELSKRGLDPQGALSRNLLTDPLIPEAVRAMIRESLQRRDTTSIEKLKVDVPGGQETLRLHSVPLRDASHSVWGILLLAELTTYTNLVSAEAERTERLAAIGRVAASLAHEINNPLQSLRAHLELIRRYRLSPQEREQSLRILEGEVERLDEITRRVLGFARPTPDVMQPVSVAQVLEGALALSRNYLQNQQVEIRVTAPGSLPPSMAAPGQLIQVFLNIILNAAHAMQGRGHLEIRIRTRGEKVEVSLANDGPPIPLDVLPHLFEPFFTTRAEGTGLGLSVSHAIVTRHHGTIRAVNLPHGRGVIFTITLPLLHENPPAEDGHG